jgi:hypothetical protein
MTADDRHRQDEPQKCQTCGHVWGAYEDDCHCNGGVCHNKEACALPPSPPATELEAKTDTNLLQTAPSAGLVEHGSEALALLTKKAHDWNAEADKYLAQRDELQVALDACQQERDLLKRSLVMLCMTEDQ